MAVILTINTPGMYITLTGVPAFRTPAKVDITKKNVALILSELKRSGITDYSINTVTIEPIIEKKKPEMKVVTNDNVDKRLDAIEGLLHELVERKPEVINIIPRESWDGEFGEGDDDLITDDDFIPTIDTTEMKMEGAPSIESVDSDIDESSAKALSKVGKKGKYNK